MRSLLLTLFLLLSVVGGGATHHFLDARFGESKVQIRPIPLSLDFFRRIAVGHEALVSDIIVISLAQYFVRPAQQRDPEWMAHMLDIATDLDKNNLAAWLFARNLMAFREEEMRASVPILQKGMRLFPNVWQFGLWLSLRFIELDDYNSAYKSASEAARIPGAPPVVTRLPVYILHRMGAYDLAINHLLVLLEKTDSQAEKDYIKKRILWIQRARQIESAANQYYQDFGKYPSTLRELERAGYLMAIPEEPFGNYFRINPRGKVYSDWVPE